MHNKAFASLLIETIPKSHQGLENFEIGGPFRQKLSELKQYYNAMKAEFSFKSVLSASAIRKDVRTTQRSDVHVFSL